MTKPLRGAKILAQSLARLGCRRVFTMAEYKAAQQAIRGRERREICVALFQLREIGEQAVQGPSRKSPTTSLSAMPLSRHKLRNAGQVFATNRETRIFAAKYA